MKRLTYSNSMQKRRHRHELILPLWCILLDSSGAPVVDEEGNPVKNSRYIYGAINPYDELTAAQLIEVRDGKIYLRYSKEDVNIEITTPLVIKADQIVPNDTGMGWQPHDPTNPDDDIIIEI